MSGYLSLEQASNYLSLAKSTLYHYAEERKIPHFKPAKKILFKVSDLDNWMMQFRVSSEDEIKSKADKF